MTQQWDVIVVGAGIAGSSCALQLARQGHRTLLLDRQRFPRHKTCGEFMSPETKEMLAHMDIRLDAQEDGRWMDQARIYLPHGGEIAAMLPGQAYGISRYRLDQLLHEKAQAAGADIQMNAAVTDIRRLEDNVYEVVAKQGSESDVFRARAVIGAYGTKQPRGVANPAKDRNEAVFVGVKSHYAGIEAANRVELYFCEGGYVGISPIEHGAVNIAALLSLKSVQGSGKSVPDILAAASQANRRLAERLAQGAPVPGTQASIAPLRLSANPDPWSQYPHVGDALLMLPPLCGDGMSVALRSALLCSRWTDQYLTGAVDRREWRRNYADEAERTFAPLLRRARWVQKLAFSRANRLYPGITRFIPGLAERLVKATRLSETGL